MLFFLRPEYAYIDADTARREDRGNTDEVTAARQEPADVKCAAASHRDYSIKADISTVIVKYLMMAVHDLYCQAKRTDDWVIEGVRDKKRPVPVEIPQNFFDGGISEQELRCIQGSLLLLGPGIFQELHNLTVSLQFRRPQRFKT
jgi:hypothetical protein